MKKKRTKRDNTQYPGLVKEVNLKIRHELMDQDYINKLSDSEKDWLSRFNEEYISANFNHTGKRVHPKKTKTVTVKKTGKKKKVDIFVKDCDDRSNARRRDTYSITKVNDMLKDEAEATEVLESNRSTNPYENEDKIIEMIDASNEINKG